MREILFKAKRIDNGEWVEGYYVKGSTRHCILLHLGGYPRWDVDKNTICQYTGMKDKNGNKIWENDIVKGTFFGYMLPAENYVSEISWQEYIGGWGSNFWHSDIEVIGNIFDNPELLEGGAE